MEGGGDTNFCFLPQADTIFPSSRRIRGDEREGGWVQDGAGTMVGIVLQVLIVE